MNFSQIQAGFKQVQAHLLIAVIAFAAGGAVGYYAVPSKVITKTETKTQSVADTKTQSNDTDISKKSDSVQKNNNKVYTRTETIAPNGTKTITTSVVDKGTVSTNNNVINTNTDKTDIDSQLKSSSDVTASKEVDHSKNDLLIYGIASEGYSNLLGGPSYGAGVQKRVLGPFWLGAFGTTTNAGVTLGIGF